MELREQQTAPARDEEPGDGAQASSLLRKARELSGCREEQIPHWLLKCAVERGASHYRRSFDPRLPWDNPGLTNEELGVALCLASPEFNPMLIRAAAQLLSSPDTDAKALARLAVAERCELVLRHIAEAAARVDSGQEPWAYIRAQLVNRRGGPTEALPHWSRFVSQTGYTPSGRGQHIEWLTRDE